MKNIHWTERSIDDFVYRIVFDFISHIDKSISSQADLADRLEVSPGRVSQMLNSPKSMSLRNVVKYARAIGRKVALVLYDDDDPGNTNGPVNSRIFSSCWERAGKPADFFELDANTDASKAVVFLSYYHADASWKLLDFKTGGMSWAAATASGPTSLSYGPAQNKGAPVLLQPPASATTIH